MIITAERRSKNFVALGLNFLRIISEMYAINE